MNSPFEHSPEAIEAARRAGEARRDSALCLVEQNRQLASWRVQAALLAQIAAAGEATSDCLHENLQAKFEGCKGNFVGAAIRKLATLGVIHQVGFAKCRRASRCGSNIAKWAGTSADAVESKLTELLKLIAALDPAPPKTQKALPGMEGAE